VTARRLHPVPDTPPRAVLYERQSVARDDSISIELQDSANREYCARMGYDVVAVFVDEGRSGRGWANRPKAQRAVEMIKADEADVIVLWKWSRLSRNRAHWAVAADTVAVAGGRIESATEPIDTGTASGRFARGVMTEYAAFQSEQIGEVWEEVRQRRLRLGLPASGRLPWGWEWVEGGIRAVPEQADVVREMYRRYLAGDGSAAISRWLNAEGIPAPNGGVWNRVRPFTVMDSPIHAGLIPYRGHEHPGAHAGIIDADTWSTYRATRAARREGHDRPRAASRYLLSGLARCGCGLKMNGKGAVTGGIWYSGYLCTSMVPDHGPSYVSSRKIDPLIQKWIESVAADIDRLVPNAPRIVNAGAVERLTAEWNAHQKHLDRLTSLLAREVVTEASYLASRAELEDEQQRIGHDLDAARARQARTPDIDAAAVRDLAADWPDLADDLRHGMLVALLEEVTIRAGESVTFRARWGDTTTYDLRT
jgi:site-specific DNA recombinase